MIRLTRVDKEPEYEMGGCVVCRRARPIMIRLTRVDKEPEYEMGGCVVCSPNWLLKQELSEIVKSISR
ncbi:unnamed protein product [Trifolium pratense]|uniref:Uncharacterized protein n=1 Tax=Trifolium pratense TaxID=57577 RepID=A0ACB0K693_TRIPR|nr:unnamed protein product [Trifolium pratense]